VSLPHLLVVDDSEAILAYQTAALSGHYTISTATNGRQALEKVREILPAAVLLDLSMPEMTGDEVLARMKADPDLEGIPVIIVSSERARSEACVRAGAAAYLPKPIRAPEMRDLVARVLDETRRRRESGRQAILFVGVGPVEVGIPLESVLAVLLQPATIPLSIGPSYLREMFDFQGRPTCILDLAARFEVPHVEPIQERKLVIVSYDTGHELALCVDRVREPEVFAPEDFRERDQIGGAEHPPLNAALRGIVRASKGPVPVIDPRALFTPELLQELARAMQAQLSSGAA